MKSNSAMKRLLQHYGESEGRLFPLSAKLITLLASHIEERDGVFLFTTFDRSVPSSTSRFGDLTGCECAINHVHLEDFVEPTNHKDRETLFKSGISFAYRLKEKLISTFPQERFRIILSYNLNDPPACVVRFHKVRAGENWIKLDDLEGYESEAVMVMDVSSR